MKGLQFVIYSLLFFLVAGGVGYIISLFNSLIQVKNNIGKAWSNIDVLLIQRNEEIPKLIDVTKMYGKYEQALMEEIVGLRKKYGLVKRSDKKTSVENELAARLRQLIGAGERYPGIKTDVLYRNAQKRISKIEDMIADRRTFFNDTVKIYNVQREQLPQALFAWMLGLRAHPYLDTPKEKTR